MAGYTLSSKHKILTREEEIVLGRAIQEGLEADRILNESHIEGVSIDPMERRRLNAAVREGTRSKDTFVSHNLRLAMDTAAKYAHPVPHGVRRSHPRSHDWPYAGGRQVRS